MTRIFNEIIGEIMVSVVKSDDGIYFVSSNGRKYELVHEQDCCEHVYIESVVGDLNDLVGQPILLAERVTRDDPDASESATWTFIKFATIKGYVDIRFHGSSNGYYSETADLYEVEQVHSQIYEDDEMNTYKVIVENIRGKIIGNSSVATTDRSPISNSGYINVDKSGAVWSLYDDPIYKSISVGETPAQLILTNEELETLFIACDEPVLKKISNITYVIESVGGDGAYFGEFDNVIDAASECQRLNETSKYTDYEVKVQFDADWE